MTSFRPSKLAETILSGNGRRRRPRRHGRHAAAESSSSEQRAVQRGFELGADAFGAGGESLMPFPSCGLRQEHRLADDEGEHQGGGAECLKLTQAPVLSLNSTKAIYQVQVSP
jgi:hypothetical protein